jgi:paraquat-inducible protein B
MSKKANPTFIGLFIVAGLALGVAGLLLFSSSKLFTRTLDCIVYFNESLNGLNQGAPVKYRGVTIGSVKRVMVRFNQASNDYAMPVIIQLEQKLINERMGEPMDVFSSEFLEERIKLGLRANLQPESLVTGVLYVDLRPNPNAAPPVFHQLEKKYPEIPSEPTQIQQLFNNLAGLDVKGIETNLNAVLAKLDTVIGSLNMVEISAGLTNVIFSAERLLTSPAISNDLASLGTTLDQYRLLGEKLNQKVDPLADNITNSLANANRALLQIQGAAENIRTLIAPDSPLRVNLDEALGQLASAVQSLSALVEFLKQHPNALITGRKVLEKSP